MAQRLLKIVVFLPSVRIGRMCIRVSQFVQNQLKDKYNVTILDPEELDLPLLKMPIHFYQDRSQIPKVLLDCEAKLEAADAFLVVTGSYNYSIPPALSNLLDHMAPGLFACKPSGIVAYSMGSFGGLEATVQLRTCLSGLGSVAIPKLLCIPEVHDALDEQGNAKNPRLEPGFAWLMKQLDWYANAMKDYRDKAGVLHVPLA